MRIEIINTGSELLLGRVLNTHQQWLCRKLADAGYETTRQVAVADTGQAIQEAVREAMGRAELILVTGGLGPTSDDITRDKIAELLGCELHEDAAVVDHVREFFTRRNRPMPDRVRIQAMVPAGAEVIGNDHGTAPGLLMAFGEAGCLVMLPGPPRELRPMFAEKVLPRIRDRFPLEDGFSCRTLKSTGIGESQMEEMLEQPLAEHVRRGLVVGFCARTGEVDIRLAARGDGSATLVADAAEIARSIGGRHIYGEEDDQLEEAVVRLLARRGETVSLAESCTGGYLGHRLTNVSGASDVFLCGYVTYSNEAKVRQLGVGEATLAEHGAVSEATVLEMARGARERSGTDYALAVTGIAGPTGGTEEKPVGTVYIGLASPAGVSAIRRLNRFDRETFKFVTAQQALELLRQALID